MQNDGSSAFLVKDEPKTLFRRLSHHVFKNNRYKWRAVVEMV
jgi:hypothetical protein